MSNLDFRRRVADTVIQVVEQHGSLPRGGPDGYQRPFNVASGTYYHGGNAVNLLAIAQLRGLQDPRWITQRQAEEAGYRLRPGAQAAYVEYWDFRGGHQGERGQPRYAVVFNGADVLDLAPLQGLPAFTAGRRAALFSAFGQKRTEDGSLHSLVAAAITQWREHAPQDAATFGRGQERETLRAELAAVFLATSLHFAGRVGVAPPQLPTAALSHDKHEIFRAAREAEVVFNHLIAAVPMMRDEYDARPKASPLSKRPTSQMDRLASLPIFPASPPPPKAKVLLDPDVPVSVPETQRWDEFSKALFSRPDVYGAMGLDSVLEKVKPTFGALMAAAEQNQIPAQSIYEVLGNSIAERLTVFNEQNQLWGYFAQDVDLAAGRLWPEASRAVQALKQKFVEKLHEAVHGQWDVDRTNAALVTVLYGEGGRCPVDFPFVNHLVERMGIKPLEPVRIRSEQPEEAFVLTPLGVDELPESGAREWNPADLVEHALAMRRKAQWDADSAILLIVRELEEGNPDQALKYTSLPGVVEGKQPAELIELRGMIDVAWAQWRAANGVGESITPTGKRQFESIPRNLMQLVEPRPHASLSDAKVAMQALTPFLSRGQARAVVHGMRGEEAQFFIDKLVELRSTIDTMPRTYGSKGEVRLHYFLNASDWYVSELDSEGKGTEQAFGFAILNGDHENAELGYISIDEIVAAGAELDFHWRPRSLDHVQAERQGFVRMERRLASIDWKAHAGTISGTTPDIGADVIEEFGRLVQINAKAAADMWKLAVPRQFKMPAPPPRDTPVVDSALQP